MASCSVGGNRYRVVAKGIGPIEEGKWLPMVVQLIQEYSVMSSRKLCSKRNKNDCGVGLCRLLVRAKR